MKATMLKSVAILCLMMALQCVTGRQTEMKRPPLALGIAYDVSASTGRRGIQAMEERHINMMISVLRRRGGTLCFGLIDENSFEPLIRANINKQSGSLDQRARISKMNRAEIDNFRRRVTGRINRERSARKTDITGAISRFSWFFNEPNLTGKEKILIVISDGIHNNGHAEVEIEIPENVRIYSVLMESSVSNALFKRDVYNFESIDSAIESIDHKTIIHTEARHANIP